MVSHFYSITIFIYGPFASEGLIFLYHFLLYLSRVDNSTPQNQENLEKHNAYLMQLTNMKGEEKKITFATWLVLQFACITASNGWYFAIILFKGSNNDIRCVLTFKKKLFPFTSKV
jgi:hypothetical protein